MALGALLGGITGSGDNPFTVAAAATHGSVVGTQTNLWQTILAGLIGTYGLVRQYQLLQKQVDLAERSVDQAEDYLDLATDAYANISIPTFTRQSTQFDRYVSTFAGYEDIYMEDAFRLKEYTPEYDVQMGRTIASVQSTFDKAALQRSRQNGRYNTGRACHDGLWFATMTALAKVDAVNHGYRYEDAKKIQLDGWYWERRSGGARINEAHADRVTGGLNGGAGAVGNGLTSIGQGVQQVQNAQRGVTEAFNNQANFFGSVSNGAFRFVGFNSYMGGANPSQNAGIPMAQPQAVVPNGQQMLSAGGGGWGAGWIAGPTTASSGIGSGNGFW